ncbi:DUF3006 domain-containing protein [Paenibacillus pini]|uniref:DUF3006 domain-containing protein n=1 Tax=Paenibacillus pini JCM 16418 TaxID=1236976 RepID=W7YKB8_9BACL|nr:DUF3006 domain-containing protein [Paenibacillus pini]GAF08957.1 hypothetical protein JCM16418_3068 [Paenibacillus pini JCM 16418]
MKGIVEGFEGSFCRIEIQGDVKDVPREQVEGHVRAGDVVEFRQGKWTANPKLTQERTDTIKKKMDNVWE